MVFGGSGRPRRRSGPGTPSITTVGRSHQDDVNSRMALYGLTMGIRVACFGLLFVLPSPWRWFAIAGAVLLPYVAVLIANAGRERMPVAYGAPRTATVDSPHRETPPTPPQELDPVQVVPGETVPGRTAPGASAGEPGPAQPPRTHPEDAPHQTVRRAS